MSLGENKDGSPKVPHSPSPDSADYSYRQSLLYSTYRDPSYLGPSASDGDRAVSLTPLSPHSSKKNGSRRSHSYPSSEIPPLHWGYPGFLLPSECDAFFGLRDELRDRLSRADGTGCPFRAAVWCFGEEEEEAYALCRWLRARKFVLADVVSMIDTAVSLRKEAAVHSFYPNPRDALGCSASAFLSQYPQLYAGRAKIGCPLHISCPGKLNLDGLQALTTIDDMLRFQWHSMVHVFGGNLRSCAKEFEGFKRYQVVSILDLDGVSISMINSTVLGIIKRQAHVDSFCFPETLNRLIIVNAPYFFSVTWKIIKGWIDQRTASKIEIISSADKSKATARLLELVDEEKLVTDYGGSYASLIELILNFENNMRSSKKDQFAKIDRRLTHVMHMHSRALSYSIPLNQGEAMDITILSQNGNAGEAIAAFEIVSPDGTQRCTEEYFTRDSQNPLTTELVLGKNIRGEGKFKIKGRKEGSASSSFSFLIVVDIYF